MTTDNELDDLLERLTESDDDIVLIIRTRNAFGHSKKDRPITRDEASRYNPRTVPEYIESGQVEVVKPFMADEGVWFYPPAK